jgi:hypothetical protein
MLLFFTLFVLSYAVKFKDTKFGKFCCKVRIYIKNPNSERVSKEPSKRFKDTEIGMLCCKVKRFLRSLKNDRGIRRKETSSTRFKDTQVGRFFYKEKRAATPENASSLERIDLRKVHDNFMNGQNQEENVYEDIVHYDGSTENESQGSFSQGRFRESESSDF